MIRPSPATRIQWLNNTATFSLDEAGTNDLLITPASYSPTTNPKYNEVTIIVTNNTIAQVTYEEAPQDGVLTYTVTPLAEGTTIVVAEMGDLTATFNLTVEAQIELEGITLSETEVSVERQESTVVTVSPVPAGASLGEITVASSDSTIATAYADDEIPSKFYIMGGDSEGEATITFTCGEFSETCTVTNTVPSLTGISFDYTQDNPLEITVGNTENVSIYITPANAIFDYTEFTGVASAEGKANFTITAGGEVEVQALSEATGLTYTVTNTVDSSITATMYINIVEV